LANGILEVEESLTDMFGIS